MKKYIYICYLKNGNQIVAGSASKLSKSLYCSETTILNFIKNKSKKSILDPSVERIERKDAKEVRRKYLERRRHNSKWKLLHKDFTKK